MYTITGKAVIAGNDIFVSQALLNNAKNMLSEDKKSNKVQCN